MALQETKLPPNKRVYDAPAKVNIFLKIVGYERGYHQIVSRFVRLENLKDKMWCEPGTAHAFDIAGDFSCPIEQNTIYKAYRALVDYKPEKKIVSFFREHRIKVYKTIPAFAGLGGGSSNAATFLKMANEILDLKLHTEELATIGEKVGADVPFFVSGYKSANVMGFGQIVQEFHDDVPELETVTPPDIQCSTVAVFQAYRKHFAATMASNKGAAERLARMTSRELLEKGRPGELNDLFPAALKLYPELYHNNETDLFFSGSGSSFFRIKK